MNNAIKGSSIWILTVFTLFCLSCNTSDDFGSGLVEDEFLDVGFDQILSLDAYTVSTDSVITYDISTRSRDSTFFVGNFTDPVFGKVEAISYFQLRYLTAVEREALGTVTVDSVVLNLGLSRLFLYGDTLQPFNLSIHRLDEELEVDTFIRSNFYPSFDANPLGEVNNYLLMPNTRVPTSDSTDIPNYIRIKLDPAFGQDVIDAPFALDSVSRFMSALRGLVVKVDENTPSPLFGINLIPRNSILNESDTRLRIYYSGPDTSGVINAYMADPQARFSSYRHDYEGSPAGNYVDQEGVEADFMFLQGLGGARPRIELPELEEMQGRSVKLAQLEVAIANDFPNSDPDLYPRVGQILIASIDEDGQPLVISDIVRFQPGGASVITSQFGGNPIAGSFDGNPVTIYRMNITSYIQEYLKGEQPSTLELYVAGSGRRPERVVLYGPDHPVYPVRLKLIYTEL